MEELTEFIINDYVFLKTPTSDFDCSLGVVREVITTDEKVYYDVEFLGPLGSRDYYKGSDLRKATQIDLHNAAEVAEEERRRKSSNRVSSEDTSEAAVILDRLSAYLLQNFPTEVQQGLAKGLVVSDILFTILETYAELKKYSSE